MYGQTVTPVTYARNNLKVPSRRLWQKENVKPGHDYWRECKKSDKEQWDGIESPQFVDFSNLPETGDSFFNKVTVIVSTPKPGFENGKLPNSFQEEEEDTLVASFNNVALSAIKHNPAVEAPHILDNGNEECKEAYVVHDASCPTEKKDQTENCAKVKKPQTITVNPFTFDLREKHKQEYKQQRIKKILEEEKKVMVFRANPVPKYLKARPVRTNKHNNNDNGTSDKNDKIKSNANDKAQGTNSSGKSIKKNAEIWKKPPFMPALTKRSSERPKAPSLHTASRAEERKRFDDIIKERETQREQARQMELAALKKQEEKEIARLRKQTVHKANPIRKYKMSVPRTDKRPLTDPMSPLASKRRRRA